MPFLGSVESKFAFGRPTARPAAAPAASGGSILFSGSSTSGLTIPNDPDFRFGTGDFTVEWFQYQTAGDASAQRIFTIGSYPTQSIAVSQEGSFTSRTFYVWVSGANAIGPNLNLANAWNHFAICRSGTSLRIFRNGTQIGTTLSNSTNFNNTNQVLAIGNESSPSAIATFNGYITNFHWVKGTALYTANFTRPSAPITPVANTKLLLRATTSGTYLQDSSGLGKVATPTGATWNALSPF